MEKLSFLYIKFCRLNIMSSICGNKILKRNLCNPTPEFSPTSCDIWQKFMIPKRICYLKSNMSILTSCTIWHISPVPWYVGLDRFHCKSFMPCSNNCFPHLWQTSLFINMQWNLSRQNFHWTKFCVQNRQVLGWCSLNRHAFPTLRLCLNMVYTGF